MFYRKESVDSDTSRDHVTTSLCGFESFHDKKHDTNMVEWKGFENIDNREILIKEYDMKLSVPTRKDLGRALLFIGISYDQNIVWCRSIYSDLKNGYYDIDNDINFKINLADMDVTDIELSNVKYCNKTKKFIYKNIKYTIEQLITKLEILHTTPHINKYQLDNPSLNPKRQLINEIGMCIKQEIGYHVYNFCRKFNSFKHTKDEDKDNIKKDKEWKETANIKEVTKPKKELRTPENDIPTKPNLPVIKLFGMEISAKFVILLIVVHFIVNVLDGMSNTFEYALDIIRSEPTTATITMMLLYSITFIYIVIYIKFAVEWMYYLIKKIIKQLYPTWKEYREEHDL